jgi:hypothetical protein
MTPYTKKNTPFSFLSTYEKRGVISVKDMSGCLTKTCDICGKKHKEFEDEFEWYGHYLEYNPKNTDVEIWDMDKKIWIKRG